MLQKAIKLQRDTLRVIKLAILMLFPFWNGIYYTDPEISFSFSNGVMARPSPILQP